MPGFLTDTGHVDCLPAPRYLLPYGAIPPVTSRIVHPALSELTGVPPQWHVQRVVTQRSVEVDYDWGRWGPHYEARFPYLETGARLRSDAGVLFTRAHRRPPYALPVYRLAESIVLDQGGLAVLPAYEDYEAGDRFPKANKIFRMSLSVSGARLPPAPSRGS